MTEIANAQSKTQEQEDKAWVSVELPLSESELLEFLQDVERLFRINPYLEFEEWAEAEDGWTRFSGKNSSNEEPFEFEYKLKVEPQADGLRVDYQDSLKKSTVFQIEADKAGSKLTITDDYGVLSDQEKEERLKEVDRSLITWAKDIRSYIEKWNRWKSFGLYRWYMRRIWQPLKPMGRRIVYMFMWITVVEIALIMLGAGIYLVEYSGLLPKWSGKF